MGGVVSDLLLSYISREILDQDMILEVIKDALANECVGMSVETVGLVNVCQKFGVLCGKYMERGVDEDSTNRIKLGELVRYQPSKSGGEPISLMEFVAHMKVGQNKFYYITGESRWPRAPIVLRRTIGWPQRSYRALRAQRIARLFAREEAAYDGMRRPICGRCGFRVNRTRMCTTCERSCCDADSLGCMWDDTTCIDCHGWPIWVLGNMASQIEALRAAIADGTVTTQPHSYHLRPPSR